MISKIQLSHLREIGWSLWDPIGLGEEWRNSGGADEYDRYILRAAELLASDAGLDECVEYLASIEVEHMGMDACDDTQERAEKTARAIEQYLASLQGVH